MSRLARAIGLGASPAVGFASSPCGDAESGWEVRDSDAAACGFTGSCATEPDGSEDGDASVLGDDAPIRIAVPHFGHFVCFPAHSSLA